MASYQEIQYKADYFDSAAVDRIRLAMLHLKSSTTTTSQEAPVMASLSKCTTSYASVKRRSPSSFSSFQEPSPKRAALYPPSSTTTTSPPLLPPQPPSSSNTNHPSILHRSLSDITALSPLIPSQSPENSFKNNVDLSASASPTPVAVAASLALPPLPPATLWRSLSDPTFSECQPAPATTSPEPQPAARNPLRSPSSGQEYHEAKTLNRIKQKLKEMSEWVEKLTSEEEEDTYSEDNCNTDPSSKLQDELVENQPEEAVWVEERSGEGLILHFKCPCSNGYEIFLCGDSCYYRLM